MAVDLIRLILGAILFALATFNVKVGSLNLVPAGLFCWILASIVS